MPYCDGVDLALRPHKAVLQGLLLGKDLKNRKIPAKIYLESQNKPLETTIVPFVGCLSISERAQIANWFEHHITDGDRTLRRFWIGLLPIAHAFTVYIAEQLTSNAKFTGRTDDERIEEAWNIQFGAAPPLDIDVDVDRECLQRLEEEMFEVSEHAGVAGNYQWGLDAGDHQNWDPYANLPEHWNHGDRTGGDSELEVCNMCFY